MTKLKFSLQFYPFYLYNKLKQIQLTKFYAVNKSSIIPIITYFNSDLEKDKAIKQNKNKLGIYR